MTFSRGYIALNDGKAPRNLNSRGDIAQSRLEVVGTLKFESILEERVSTADKCVGWGFEIHFGVFAFSGGVRLKSVD